MYLTLSIKNMAETKQISATINAERADTIERLAKEDDISFSKMVDRLLKLALSKITAPPKKQKAIVK